MPLKRYTVPRNVRRWGSRKRWIKNCVRMGIKVGVICPGGVKTEFALGKGRTEEGVAQSGMLDPEDVAGAVLLACTQSAHSRIIEIRMRPMVEPLA